ncbi:DUF4232 domain-containing protein [Streptomyces shenzhenensis]|uniref:DUF4232 domain-containing protein n=1 Tax=Streptomyces shenzhenensis TaxID=943815 RepID=A0A3M0I929_9ACTN|nr:DUF4232 domain-containing protein [Streptomyces shenzhenensis]RMB86031.1 hypothetical protein CTZ28_11055 [Streptomyces shenzhenensis]
MAYTSQTSHRAALLVTSVAVLGLLTACGDGSGVRSGPQQVTGTAADATGGGPTAADTAADGTTAQSPAGEPPAGEPSSLPASDGAAGTGATPAAGGTRCHTSELSASVGRNNPGAGQENFPVVLTNESARTCTVRGYPGAAFVNASGGRLGPDPIRSSGTPTTVTLKPGRSAWAGLTFSNPEISGARTATPAALLITPPDERDQLKVAWTAGAVPVSGNASAVLLTVLAPGNGA